MQVLSSPIFQFVIEITFCDDNDDKKNTKYH